MATKLYLTFSETTGDQSEEFEWEVLETPLAKRWQSEMIRGLKDFSRVREQQFFGWAIRPADQAKRVAKLNRAIAVINNFYGDRYHIEQRACLGMPQDLLNQLHHHFEILIGQVWNPSILIKDIPIEVHLAVRDLNETVHEYEFSERARYYLEMGERVVGGFHLQLAPFEHKELTIEDLKTFSYDNEPGNISTNYCQLGKTWTEVCIDNDEHIAHDNIAPLRYFTSAFICNFHWHTPTKSQVLLDKVKAYINDKRVNQGWNVDADDPRNALGHAHYATLDHRSPLRNLSDSELTDFFCTRPNVSKIRIVSGAEEVSRSFRDPDSRQGKHQELLSEATTP
jgi:hypothetical protein